MDKFLSSLTEQIEDKQAVIANIHQRVKEWENCYKKIPLLYKLPRFSKSFSRKIQTEFRLFMNEDELELLNENMSLDDIKEEYSKLYADCSKTILDLKKKKEEVLRLKKRYDTEIEQLKQHHIDLRDDKDEKYNINPDYINSLLDKKHRYVEFWLAVHYFECMWASGEDELTEKQKGKNFANVLKRFYNRLSMITPCLVMTFFTLPKQFLAYGDQKNFFLYNYIDLLIVDEAGQVTPEIAAGAFSLAKKSVVVGDVYQIEPVWSVNRPLDKSLALSGGVIHTTDEYELLERTGLNSSCSSVMKVAAKSC